MTPKNLDFEIVFCSSEEDEGSIFELLSPGPTCKGWVSAKYCIYPQEIVVKLDARSTIDQIQFLAHNYMIPSSIEIWLGDVAIASEDPELSKAMFYCLGEIAMADNTQTVYKGRQLQAVEMGNDDTRKNFVKGRFIKFILKQNHHVKLNEYNQVGLMGLAIFGTPEPPNGRRNIISLTDDWTVVIRRQDLGFLMYTDRDVSILIHQLECRKYVAVEEERFDRARRLKDAIAELMVMGPTLGALEVEKRRFVERQDYEGAKQKKAEQDEMRDACYRDLAISELLEYPSPSRRNSFVGRTSSYAVLPPPILHKTRPQQEEPAEESEVISTSPLTPTLILTKPNLIPSKPRRFSTGSMPVKKKTPPPKSPKSPSRMITLESEENSGVELSFNDKKDLPVAIEVFGEPFIATALDKAPSSKESACERIKKFLFEYDPEDDPHMKPPKVLRGTTQILLKFIKDKVWSVFCHSISITNVIFSHFIYKNSVPKKDLADSAVKIFKELLVRTTDTNERCQVKADEALRKIITNSKVLPLGVIQEIIMAPLQPVAKEHPRVAMTKAELVLYFMSELPDLIGTQPTTVTNLARFALSAVDSSTPAVKKLGEKIMVRLYDLDPKAVRKVMPKDSPAIRKTSRNYKTLFEKFDRLDGIDDDDL